MSALATVARNRSLVLLVLSWTASLAASWIFLIAALVVAYRTAGPAGVGAVGVARMLPAVAAAPLVVTLERHLPGRRLLVAIHLFRLAATAVVALCLVAGAPPFLLIVLVAIKAAPGVIVRPILFGLVPALAAAPEEVVAANVGVSTGEGAATLIGPIIGGFVVAAAGPVAACGATAITLVIALVLAAAVHVHEDALVRPAAAAPLRRLQTGLLALREHPAAGVILACFLAQVVVRGALSVLLVVAAIELLGLGDSGVGLLQAAIGLGGFVGALVALAYAGVRRLSRPFAIALAVWGLPIAIVGLVPSVPVALVALPVVGAANALLDVSGFTLLQRVVPNAKRTAVLGLLESMAALGVAVGSFLAPIVIGIAGRQGAMVAVGMLLPLTAALTWPRLAHVDDHAVVPERELTFLRSMPIFAPLPMTVIERLAADLTPVDFEPGEVIVREGEAATTFYGIEDGTVEVLQGDRLVWTQGKGAAIGEIGLLRRVRRTATVRAVTKTRAYALRGDAFIAAVTGNPASVVAADTVIADRLARAPSQYEEPAGDYAQTADDTVGA